MIESDMKKHPMNAFLLLIVLCLCGACGGNKKTEEAGIQQEVQTYLDGYNRTFQELYTRSSEAEWKSNTRIVEGDTATQNATKRANEAFAVFTGSAENIEKARKYLDRKKDLTPLQVKQLEAILYAAGSNPQTVADVVKQRIDAQAKQTEKLYGYSFKIDGKEVSTNDIDRILRESTQPAERRKAWVASKEVGKELKEGLVNLQRLRNETVKGLGFSDFFAYQVSEYGMSSDELLEITRNMVRDVWPLYRELHTYARYELAKKYRQPVPDLLPADWLPNRWGQDWSSMVEVKGLNLDDSLKKKPAEWIVKEGENFYKSLGFGALPASFYEKSSLYPLPKGTPYKKNTHASAWHMDLNEDVRSLMSVEANSEWWETTLHELGHIYYYQTYTNPNVPIILRGGANRAFHEAMGSQMGLASMQKPFLVQMNLVDKNARTDQTQTLLKEALNYIVAIPWSAGVMTEFEHDLYAKNLPKDQYNARWWQLVKENQGMVPPTPRGEEYCDAATKTHINDDAAQYYDYSMSFILLFQFHDHVARNILKQDPHATNYFGSKETGQFLMDLMRPGATADWRQLLKEKLGTDMSAKPMVNYFEPLMAYLKEANKGRTYTLPEKK
jgi:peptidyl-dipeptidase A